MGCVVLHFRRSHGQLSGLGDESVLAEAFALPCPVIVDVVVDREENVAPMVPAGKGLDEMLLV